SDRALFQIQGTDEMVFSVGNVERFAFQGHALGVIELGLVKTSILPSWLAVAGDGDLLALQVRNNNAVMGAVGDEQALAGGVGENFAGEEQRTVALLREASQLKAARLLVQRFLLLVNLDELSD